MRACPACGGYNPQRTGEEWISKSVECLYRQEFVLPDGCPLDSAYDLLWCKLCGIAYADVNPGGFERYYRDFDVYKAIECDDRSDDDSGRISQRYGMGKKILDFGCGSGAMARRLEWRLNRVAAYDGSVDFNTFCVHSLRKMKAEESGFDVVTMMHVLEHCYDPALELRKAASVLAEQGQIYLEVPDSVSYEDDVLQEFNCEHINHFTVHGIDKLLDRTDLELLYIERGRMTPNARGEAYPVIRAAARRCVANRRGMRVDWSGLPYHSYLDYFNRGYTRLDRIRKQLELLERQGGFMIWGCGQLAWKLLKFCTHKGLLGMYDSNPSVVGRHFTIADGAHDSSYEVLPASLLTKQTGESCNILACSIFGSIEKEAAARGIKVVELAK